MSMLNGQNEQDQELLHTIDQALAQPQAAAGDARSLPGVCAQLASTVPQPDAAFAQRVEELLVVQAMKQQNQNATHTTHHQLQPQRRRTRVLGGWRGAFIGIAATFVLLFGTVAAIPPARAWAQTSIDDVLAYFNLDRTVPNFPSASGSVYTGSASAVEENTGPVPSPEPELTQEQATLRMGFSVKAPTYLPSGYVAQNTFVANEGSQAISWTADKSNPDTPCDLSLELAQASVEVVGDRTASIGDATATPLMILGNQALLLEHLPQGPCRYGNDRTGEEATVIPLTSVLTWKQDGVWYKLSAESRLSRDELVKVAESLK